MAKLAPRFRPFSGLYVPDTDRELVPAINQKKYMKPWRLTPAMTKMDFLDLLVMMLERPVVKDRIAAEFEAEAVVKEDKLVQIETFGGVDDIGDIVDTGDVYDVKDVLNEVQVTYGSWTLSDYIPLWMEVHEIPYEDDAVCDVALKTNKSRKSDYVLRCAIKSYLLTKKKSSIALWKKVYLVGQAYQRAVYGWNEKKNEFGVQAENYVYRAYPHFDQSFLGDISKLVKGNVLFTKLGDKQRVEAVTQINKIKEEIGWGQVDILKKANALAALKVGTGKIMMPENISEVTFRMMVRAMTDVVFVGDGAWSAVVIEHDEKDRLNAALCLLMLGIGSRARGIIMVNEIEALNYTVIESVKEDMEGLVADKEEKDKGLVELRHQLVARTIGIGTMRVKRLTKEKDDAVMAGAVMRHSREYKGKVLTEDEAMKIVGVEKSGRMIDKPFLYMFFSRRGDGDGAQVTFIQLLKTVRDCMKTLSENWFDGIGGVVNWEQYETLGRKIWVLARKQELDGPKEVFMRRVKVDMQRACVHYIGGWLPHLQNHTPHQLRRMYVCYAYEYFGRTLSKEIAFAQYVLRHTTISSSMRYTTLNFVMALSDGMSKDKKFKSKFAEKMAELDEMKERVLELEGMIEVGGGGGGVDGFNERGRRKRKMTAMFRDGSGDLVVLKKMKRAKRATSHDDMIARAIDQVGNMRMLDIPLTRVNVTKAGVNTNIIEEIMGLIRDMADGDDDVASSGSPEY